MQLFVDFCMWLLICPLWMIFKPHFHVSRLIRTTRLLGTLEYARDDNSFRIMIKNTWTSLTLKFCCSPENFLTDFRIIQHQHVCTAVTAFQLFDQLLAERTADFCLHLFFISALFCIIDTQPILLRNQLHLETIEIVNWYSKSIVMISDRG